MESIVAVVGLAGVFLLNAFLGAPPRPPASLACSI